MIVKRNFHPFKVWQYIKSQMIFVICSSFAVWAFAFATDTAFLAINFTPFGVLGGALAIFVAFKNNSAYGRWWEARTIWGGLVNSSREFARMVINFVDVQIRAQPDRREEMDDFKKVLIHRQIAFVHALRLHLRKQDTWQEIQPFVSEEEYTRIITMQNKPYALNCINGDHLRRGQDKEMLQWFHTFQIEGNLTQFANYQGACERIKNTPLPRQYDFFTRVFVSIFSFLLPFGLLSFFLSNPSFSWIIIPLSILIAGTFIIMERTGAANENPFENQITDIPLTALCNTIERDLKEALGEENLPKRIEPVDGYLD